MDAQTQDLIKRLAVLPRQLGKASRMLQHAGLADCVHIDNLSLSMERSKFYAALADEADAALAAVAASQAAADEAEAATGAADEGMASATA